MSIRRSSIVLIALGVILVVVAALAKFVVEPSVSKLPSSLNVTNTYTGKGTLLNAAAVQSGDMQNAIAKDVPVTVVRHTYISSTSGDTAIVHDDLKVNAPNGVSLPTKHAYAVNRKTMQSATAPEGQTVEAHQGLTVALPLRPDADADFTMYDFATQATYPMKRMPSTTVAGREVLNYTVSANGPLKDTAMASALPPALPKAQLAQIINLLPAQTRSKLTSALPTLPDLVPISYTADSTISLLADKTLGTPVDSTRAPISVIPVLALDTTLNDKSVAAAADSASSATTKLNLISIWIPLALLVLGLAAIVLGVIRRRPKATATA